MESSGKKRPRKTKLVCRQVVELDEELQKLINATQDITSNETDEIYDKVVLIEPSLNEKPEDPPQEEDEKLYVQRKVKPRQPRKKRKQIDSKAEKKAANKNVKSYARKPSDGVVKVTNSSTEEKLPNSNIVVMRTEDVPDSVQSLQKDDEMPPANKNIKSYVRKPSDGVVKVTNSGTEDKLPDSNIVVMRTEDVPDSVQSLQKDDEMPPESDEIPPEGDEMPPESDEIPPESDELPLCYDDEEREKTTTPESDLSLRFDDNEEPAQEDTIPKPNYASLQNDDSKKNSKNEIHHDSDDSPLRYDDGESDKTITPESEDLSLHFDDNEELDKDGMTPKSDNISLHFDDKEKADENAMTPKSDEISLRFDDNEEPHKDTIPPELDDEDPPEFDEEELERDKQWSSEVDGILNQEKIWCDFEINVINEERTVLDPKKITQEGKAANIETGLLNKNEPKAKADEGKEQENRTMQFSVNVEVEEYDYENEADNIDDDFYVETSNLKDICPHNDVVENPNAFFDHDYENTLNMARDEANPDINDDESTVSAYELNTNLNDSVSEGSDVIGNHDIKKTTKYDLWNGILDMDEYCGPVHQVIQIHMRNNFGKLYNYVFKMTEFDKKLENIYQTHLSIERYSKKYSVYSSLFYCYKCYICRKAWYYLYDFKMHMRNHNVYEMKREVIKTSPFMARIVAYSGTYKYEYISINGKCSMCSKSSEDHETFSCYGCAKSFENCVTLRLHEGVCENYNGVYTQKYGLDAQYLHCVICRLCYFSVDEFKSHFLHQHSPRSDSFISMSLKECSYCKRNVPSLYAHICAKKPLFYVCPHCDMKFCNRDMLNLHKETITEILCKFCGSVIKYSCQEAEHMLVHTDKYTIVYRCVLCINKLFFFKNISDFKTHKGSHHPDCNPKQFAHQMMILPSKCFGPEPVATKESNIQDQIDEEARLLEEQIKICSTAPIVKPNILSKNRRKSARSSNLKRPNWFPDENGGAEVEKQDTHDKEKEDSDKEKGDSNKTQNHKRTKRKPKTVKQNNTSKKRRKETSIAKIDVSNVTSSGNNRGVHDDDVDRSMCLVEATMEIISNSEVKPESIEYEEDTDNVYNMSIHFTKEMADTSDKYADIEPKVVLDTILRKTYKCGKCGYLGCHKEYKIHVAGRCKPKPTIDTLQPGNIKDKAVFRCTKCYEENTSFKDYIKHLKDHGFQNYQCPQCSQIYRCNQTLANHILIHVKETYQRIIYLSAEQKRQNYCYRCKLCKLELTDTDFFEHWESHLELNFIQEYDEYYFCGDMDNKYSMLPVPETLLTEPKIETSPVELKGGCVSQTDPMLIHIDNSKMGDLIRYLLRSKASKRKDKNICLLCGKQFSRVMESKRHIIEHLLIQAFAHKPVNCGLKCQICGMLHQKPDNFKHHMREHARLPVFICEICNRSFSDSSNFAKHKKIHNFKCLICDHCGRKFQLKKWLVAHLENHKKRNLKCCEYCDQKFPLVSALNKHIKRVHLGEKTFHQCQICRQKFPNTKKKLDHMWQVHKYRNDKADCPLCGTMFRRLIDVNRHIRQMHPFDEVPLIRRKR